MEINQVLSESIGEISEKCYFERKKDVVSFVKYKLNSARSFIDAVEQRNNTLMLTMTAIVQFQKQFFLTGEKVA